MVLSVGMLLKIVNIILMIEIFALTSFLFYLRYKAYKAKKETERWIEEIGRGKQNGEGRNE